MDTDSARRALEEMLADLDRSAATLAGENAGYSGELSTVDQHPADTASELSDADREDAVLEVVRAQRAQVKSALARLAEGSYGRCVDCGRPVQDERLEARPEAARCVACQAKLEGGR